MPDHRCAARVTAEMGAERLPRVGTAAWTAARLAWRDRATASAKALIETRTVGPTLQSSQTDALTRSRSLGAGTHLTPVHRPSMPASDCWPPGTSTSARPGMASRHVIDDAFDPHDLSILVAAAKTTMGPAIRTKDGEASVAALGRASEEILGAHAHVAMRRTLRAMAETAARAVHRISPDIPGDGVGDIPGDDDDTRSQTPKVPILHPVGGLFTHIVPKDEDGEDPPRQHGYWSAHVDKANVPEYDVSAVLYLSDGGGVDFDGGEVSLFYSRTGN